MKKLIFLITALFIINGCGQIPDGVVEPDHVNFKVEKITAPYSFENTDADSTFIISIQLAGSEGIIGVYFNLVENTAADEVYSMQSLLDDGRSQISGDITAGDNIFSASITMSRLFAVGNYSIEFFIRNDDDLQTISKAAVHQFYYDNGQSNVEPVISDVIAPDTVVVQEPKSVILLSVFVSDENGLQDIESVYFTTTRPDGSVYPPIQMFDSGDFENHGDETASDGRFSALIQVTPSNTKGAYKFNFQAKDKRKKLSNIITHTIHIL